MRSLGDAILHLYDADTKPPMLYCFVRRVWHLCEGTVQIIGGQLSEQDVEGHWRLVLLSFLYVNDLLCVILLRDLCTIVLVFM